MQTRREFLKQAGILLAGGVAAAVVIVPAVPEEVHPLSARPWIEVGNAMMDGVADGIRTSAGTWHNAAYAVDDFIDAVEHQSPLRLDSVGICLRQTELNEAYRQYAVSLGKTDWQLTDSERRAAFLSAALEAAHAQG